MVWLAGGPATIDMWDLKPERPRGHPRRVQADRHHAPTASRSASTCRRWPRSMDKVTIVRSLAPHHPVARPGHRLHDHRQQADRRPCSTRRSARWRPSCCRPSQGVPPYVTFSELRNGAAGRRRLPRHRLQPVRRRRRRRRQRPRPAAQPPRPRHHAADRLHARRPGEPRQAAAGLRQTASQALDKSADLVDGLDAFHKQALDILRSDKTKKAFDLDAGEARPSATRYGDDAVRPGRAGGPPAGRGRRPLRHHQPRRLGHAQPELQRPQDPPAAARSTRRCRP